MKKFSSDKLNEECGIFGISNHEEASALVALGLHAFNIEVKRDVVSYLLMEKIITQKKDKV